jgi:type II secretory pathway pseudopilin PulG
MKHYGFTIIEVLVIAAIIALLLAVLVPLIYSSKASGRTAICSNQLHQIGSLFITATTDGAKTAFPDKDKWPDDSYQRCLNKQLFMCPDAEIGFSLVNGLCQTNYGINTLASEHPLGSNIIILLDYGQRLANPDLVIETQNLLNQNDRHLKRINVLWGSNEVKQMTALQLSPVNNRKIWDP